MNETLAQILAEFSEELTAQQRRYIVDQYERRAAAASAEPVAWPTRFDIAKLLWRSATGYEPTDDQMLRSVAGRQRLNEADAILALFARGGSANE